MANLQTSTVHPTEDTPSTSGGYYYEVFISHRGPDLKDTFASHAYHRLLSHGVRPFFDREELRKGESLSPQIKAAIRTAAAHIAIFSPGYADSKWCLDELSLICKSGATIIPVFHNVEPCELRWTKGAEALTVHEQKGRYAEALAVHEQKGRYEPERLEDWRKALKDVSEISGFELKTYNGDEGKLLDDLVKCVLKKLRPTGLTVATYPTGLEEKLTDFEKILSLQEGQSAKVKVMGIVGMGGIGKTTVAKELFNKKSCNFGESCFLFDVRENASRGSLNSLQSKLIKDLVRRDVQINHIDEGTKALKTYLKTSPHALVVLDDVDHADQLNAFRPLKDVLRSDSLILVTSRYKDVLTSSGLVESSLVESSIYRMTGLNEQHSQELFCSYAFCNPHSPSEFKDLVDEFCRACDGLPLSLKVFGSFLCGGRDKSYWEGLLNKLSQIKLPNEVQQTLKLSYDALEEEEKQIFLEIACYFIGEDRDMAIRIWDGSGWNGQSGLENLQDRCLVDVDTENNTIKMHDHLRDLGRQIVDQQKSCGVIPYREWRVTKDIPELWRQYSVITEVRGIRTVHRLNAYPGLSAEGSSWLKSWCEEVFGNCLRKLIDPSPYRFSKLQLVATEGDDLKSILNRVKSPDLIWLRWSDCADSCLPSWLLNLMKNVRVLEVSGKKLGTLWRTKSQAPLELRELTIHSSRSLFKFPKSIGQLKHIEKIVVYSGVELLPEEFCDLHFLKYLDMSGSERLKMLPDSFGCLTNLVHLDLSSSSSLQMLPNSFGNLIRLKYLNLNRCSELTISNETFANLRSLEELHLRGTNLQKLPEDIRNLRNLEVFTVGSHSLKELPCSLGHLSRLKHMELVYCRELKSLPDSLGLLTQLSELKIEECGIESLPAEMEKLSNLVKLTVKSCPIRELPLKSGVEGALSRLEYLELERTEIWKICLVEGVCPSLKFLNILYCNDLVEVGALPPTLIKLLVLGCNKLRKIEGLYNLTNLQELDITWCKELEELPCLERLISLKTIRVYGCHKVRKMEGLHNLTNLQELEIWGCKELEELPCLERLISLKKITLYDCDKVRKMEGLHNLTNLQELHLTGCKELEELPCLERLISLKNIYLKGCDKVRKMEGLHNLTNLQTLEIRRCKELEELPCRLERLISLKKITLYDCDKVRKMEGLHNLTNLQELHLTGCKELEELPCLERLISLKNIYLKGCDKVRKMKGLHNLTNLQELYIGDCKELEELPCLERLISLKMITLYDCDKVRKIEGLHNLTNLQELYIGDCKELEELLCLERLISLKKITLNNCHKVRKMEGLHNLTNLRELWIWGCEELEEVPCVERLISLKKIKVDRCRKLKRIEGLGQLTQLQELHIKECEELEELPCLERLISLKTIYINDCRKLERIEGLGQLTQLEQCSVVVYIDGQRQREQQLD